MAQSDGSRTNIWASRYVSGTWEAPVPLETDNVGNARNVQIAADRYGNALAVWQQFDAAATTSGRTATSRQAGGRDPA